MFFAAANDPETLTFESWGNTIVLLSDTQRQAKVQRKILAGSEAETGQDPFPEV
jgi:hypothetical protein